MFRAVRERAAGFMAHLHAGGELYTRDSLDIRNGAVRQHRQCGADLSVDAGRCRTGITYR